MRDFAGAVIGRGGEHVTDIRKESGALIHVCKPDFTTGVFPIALTKGCTVNALFQLQLKAAQYRTFAVSENGIVS